MKNLFELSQEEKNRIINLHENATKRLYLVEQEVVQGGNGDPYQYRKTGDKVEYATKGIENWKQQTNPKGIEAINKLMLLPLLGGPNIQAEFVKKTVGQVIDFVIHLERNQTGFRQVAEIIEISNDSIRDNIKINSIYTANQSKRKLSEAV